METEETPNELNILTSENSEPKKKNFDVKQYFLDLENHEEEQDESPIILRGKDIWCAILFIFLFTSAILIGIIIMIDQFLKTHQMKYIVYSIISLIFIVIFVIVILCLFPKQYEFSKNIQKNKFYIKKINLWNKPSLNLELTLGNYIIKCEEYIDYDKGPTERYSIHLYNQLYDISEINLDTTNRKKVPITLYFTFDISLKEKHLKIQLEKRLNKYICTKNVTDPFLFHKNKFLTKTKYKKYCDYFFTFYFESFEKTFGGIMRIDCIYSENFDRIFIGIVNSDEKSYAQTFEFIMDNIDKFILQKFKNCENRFDLKVIFKDKQIQHIWHISDNTQRDLEGLAYLLNEKLNK